MASDKVSVKVPIKKLQNQLPLVPHKIKMIEVEIEKQNLMNLVAYNLSSNKTLDELRQFGKAQIIRTFVINEFRFKRQYNQWQYLELHVLIAKMICEH